MMDDSLGRLFRLNQWLGRLPRRIQLLLAMLLLVICALADHYTGTELSFSITYLAPTALAAWYAGAAAGLIMAIAASILWLVIDLLSGSAYSHPMIPVWNSLVRLGFFFIVTALLLKIRNLLGRLQVQAERDGLTGLANRHSFYLRLDQERERAMRYRHPVTLAYLDLDNFKQVNDTWGHTTGDQLLRAIAACLIDNLRKTDLVARLGGDEFALLLTETGEKEADEVLRKLHTRMQARMAEHSWPVGCSIGAITCRNLAQNEISDLIRQADELMYQVKRSGKNRMELLVIA